MGTMKLAPTPFEQWASSRGYDVAPAVVPAADRTYADSRTQEVYEAWRSGGGTVARMLAESTIETEALREKIRGLAG